MFKKDEICMECKSELTSMTRPNNDGLCDDCLEDWELFEALSKKVICELCHEREVHHTLEDGTQACTPCMENEERKG